MRSLRFVLLVFCMLLPAACKLDTTSPMVKKGMAPPPPSVQLSKPQIQGDSKAQTSLERAAAAGQKDAMYQLGMQHCCGDGGTDMDTATRWLCRAWKAGDARAAYALGQAYIDDTPKQDFSLALAYLQLARNAGVQEAEGIRSTLVTRLDSTTLSRGLTYAMQAPRIPCETGKIEVIEKPAPSLPRSMRAEYRKRRALQTAGLNTGNTCRFEAGAKALAIHTPATMQSTTFQSTTGQPATGKFDNEPLGSINPASGV